MQFPDMCILCGCDYCGSLPYYIGNKTAFNHIKKFKGIKAMLPKVKAYYLIHSKPSTKKIMKNYLLYTMILPVDKLDYHNSVINLDGLVNYLTSDSVVCLIKVFKIQLKKLQIYK